MVPVASAESYWDFLTKGRADTLYCKLTGCTMEGDIDMGGFNLINATYVNATYINTTINGVGERAGNADLISVILAIKHSSVFSEQDILDKRINILKACFSFSL